MQFTSSPLCFIRTSYTLVVCAAYESSTVGSNALAHCHLTGAASFYTITVMVLRRDSVSDRIRHVKLWDNIAHVFQQCSFRVLRFLFSLFPHVTGCISVISRSKKDSCSRIFVLISQQPCTYCGSPWPRLLARKIERKLPRLKVNSEFYCEKREKVLSKQKKGGAVMDLTFNILLISILIYSF